MRLFLLMIFSCVFAQHITACCKSLCTNKQEQRQKKLDKSLEIALCQANFDQVLLALAQGAKARNIIARVDSRADITRFFYGNEKIFKLLLVSLFSHECAEEEKMATWQMLAKNACNCTYACLFETLEHIIIFYKINGRAVLELGNVKYMYQTIKLRTSLGYPPKLNESYIKFLNSSITSWRSAYDEGHKLYSERHNEFLEVFEAIPYDLRGPYINADVPPTFTTKTIYFDRLSIFMTALDETVQQTATERVPLVIVGIIKDYVLYSYEEHLRLAGCYDLQDELKQLEEQLAAAREQEKGKEVAEACCAVM